MKEKLDLIEARLQALIEGSMTLVLPYGNPQRVLAHRLIESMQSNISTQPDGRSLAPNLYRIEVHPSRAPFWQANQGFLDELANELYRGGTEAGFSFIAPPVLGLAYEDNIQPHEMRVSASIGRDPLSSTSTFAINAPKARNDNTENLPGNAFLIVNGVQNYPLRETVINIGRRPDNHLIINDPRVSRSHAQIRAVKGRYVLFDLNSTGGTLVNGQRITQYPLNPGDVISLAGVPLIYGQDNSSNISQTNSFPPFQSDDSGQGGSSTPRH